MKFYHTDFHNGFGSLLSHQTKSEFSSSAPCPAFAVRRSLIFAILTWVNIWMWNLQAEDKISSVLMVQWNGSTIWSIYTKPEFNSKDSHGERRKLSPSNCLLLLQTPPEQADVFTHTHTQCERDKTKQLTIYVRNGPFHF